MVVLIKSVRNFVILKGFFIEIRTIRGVRRAARIGYIAIFINSRIVCLLLRQSCPDATEPRHSEFNLAEETRVIEARCMKGF